MPKKKRTKASKAKKKKNNTQKSEIITINHTEDDEVKELSTNHSKKDGIVKQKMMKKRKRIYYYNDDEKKLLHQWGPIKMELIDLITSFSLLPAVLCENIVGYLDTIQWDPKAIQSWTFPAQGKPRGITYANSYLYICDSENNILLCYNLNGELIIDQSTSWPSHSPLLLLQPSSSSSSSPSFSLLSSSSISDKPFNQPCAIEYYDNHLYMIDENQLHILNLKREILSQWKLPTGPGHGVKVDEQFIYITLENIHQIFIYTKLGCLMKKFGKEEKGISPGQFNRPFGLTFDDHINPFLYVCDYNNHRIQVLNKDTGFFSHLWGTQGSNEEQLNWPFCIYFNEYIIYVGDSHGVQLYTPQGTFLQKIGGRFWGNDEISFKCAWGICIANNILYVCDWLNHRIQVFRKKTDVIPPEIEVIAIQ